jgi:hypothetical protein
MCTRVLQKSGVGIRDTDMALAASRWHRQTNQYHAC